MSLLLVPVVVMGVVVGTIVWWVVSMAAEGLEQVRSVVRTANR